ncbi:MAG: hypothetical protein ACK5WY_06660 [Holosporaceae bacterium]|jgi:hypothetical protein
MSLTVTYKKYSAFYPEWHQKEDGSWIESKMPMTSAMMLPDVVLDALREALAPVVPAVFQKNCELDCLANVVPPLNKHRILIAEPAISWQQSCDLVVAAFRSFNPDLTKQVAQVMTDASLLRLRQVSAGEAGGYCTAPGYEAEGHLPGITYWYDLTINDPIYLAHELGHFGSDSLIRQAGLLGDSAMMPLSLCEIPAMVTQHLMYDYLSRQVDSGLVNAARKHFVGEVTGALYRLSVAFAGSGADQPDGEPYEQAMQVSLGENWRYFVPARDKMVKVSGLHKHDSALVLAYGLLKHGQKPDVFDAIFARGSKADILEILAQCGIHDKAALVDFFSKAVQGIVAPLEQIYQEQHSIAHKEYTR